MSDQSMLTEIDGSILAEAFSANHRLEALSAGDAVARLLDQHQWTDRFTVQADGQSVLIPARLRFASDRLGIADSERTWRFARALQTRSNDGFERQRAARDLMDDLQPWSAPFIVTLIGEYIVEILNDIYAALTPHDAQTVAAFIVQNEAYWGTTKRRVMSYWDVYYRSRRSSETRHCYRRDEYVGFKLIDRLETAAIG